MQSLSLSRLFNSHFSRWIWVIRFYCGWWKWRWQLCFNGHFPDGPGLASTRMSLFWILLKLRMTEVVVKTGAIRSANPTNSVKALKGKLSHSMLLLTPSSPGVFQLCLWPLIAPLVTSGRVAMPLISPLMLVPKCSFNCTSNTCEWNQRKHVSACLAAINPSWPAWAGPRKVHYLTASLLLLLKFPLITSHHLRQSIPSLGFQCKSFVSFTYSYSLIIHIIINQNIIFSSQVR